jgi:hypothetical protein
MTEVPFGIITNKPFILQGNDQWYDEERDEWRRVELHLVGKWSDDFFDDDVKMRGYLYRLSDAVHPCRFQAVYGRPKPTCDNDKES